MTENPDANGPWMRAVIVRQPGGVEQLEVARIKTPALAPGCIEIDVEASALTTVIAMINLWNRLGVSVH